MIGNRLNRVGCEVGEVAWGGGGAVGRRLVQQGEPGRIDVEPTVQV